MSSTTSHNSRVRSGDGALLVRPQRPREQSPRLRPSRLDDRLHMRLSACPNYSRSPSALRAAHGRLPSTVRL